MTDSTDAGTPGGVAADRRRAHALAVLGLPAAATPAEITRRFRELAKATHPDTSPDAGAAGDPRAVAPDLGTDRARRMTAICDAYHLLTATPAEQAAAAPQPAAQTPSPVSVPVRRDPRRRADPQPWVVAGPVRVEPWSEPPAPPRRPGPPTRRSSR